MEGLFSGRSTRAYKQKISYYNENGKGTINLKYPKIKKGIALAFMESTSYDDKRQKTVILVESENCHCRYINLPEYIWIAYGGINGLTKSKLPTNWTHRLDYSDMSENAVNIIYSKIPLLIAMGINARCGI
jgi:hypothetical protein